MDIPQKQLPPLKSQISVITEGAMPNVILSLTETRGISSAVLKALCSSEGDFQAVKGIYSPHELFSDKHRTREITFRIGSNI